MSAPGSIEFICEENGGWWYLLHGRNPVKGWRIGSKAQIKAYLSATSERMKQDKPFMQDCLRMEVVEK